MREKLIEILKNILPTRGIASGIPITQKWDYEAVADKLIGNGVIVMPCNVGDTVYEIDERYTKCTPYGERFSAYACAGCEKSCDSRKEHYIRPVEITNIHWIFNMWDYYGETWFTDPKAAQKALKARKQNE